MTLPDEVEVEVELVTLPLLEDTFPDVELTLPLLDVEVLVIPPEDVEVDVDPPVVELSMSITIPLELPELDPVVVVLTTTLPPPDPPPKKPPKKPPPKPPNPPPPPIKVGAALAPPVTGGGGGSGARTGTGTLAYA
ncbi:hypothetical protein [Tsuneonella aeria]|uniref:hypothetical protein n=1 Tax=Tsuneonella aeria TaxID=1837929 RepID=UPI001925CFC8|nr:hypothetical protein [Tsuneonella aeria]